MEPFGNLIGTSKSQKIKNCLEINFGIVPKKKSQNWPWPKPGAKGFYKG